MERPPALLDRMPADALPYFQKPTAGTQNFTNVTPTLPLFGADPNRVLILLGTNVTGAVVYVGPTGLTGTGQGFAIAQNVPSAVFTYWEHGPIVTMAWEGSVQTSGGVAVSWIIQSLAAWPDSDGTPLGKAQAIGEQIKAAQRPIPVRGPLWQKWLKKLGM